MESIKCLLLLAAVLAFAAMNAAAMDDGGDQIRNLGTTALENILRNEAHDENRALHELMGLSQQGILHNVPTADNWALNELCRVAREASGRNANPQDNYQALAGENGEICSNFNSMEFLKCLDCCTVKGIQNQQQWTARLYVFMDYSGRCVCRNIGAPPPGEEIYLQSLIELGGEVIDPGE
jgi:hypothetical protein